MIMLSAESWIYGEMANVLKRTSERLDIDISTGACILVSTSPRKDSAYTLRMEGGTLIGIDGDMIDCEETAANMVDELVDDPRMNLSGNAGEYDKDLRYGGIKLSFDSGLGTSSLIAATCIRDEEHSALVSLALLLYFSRRSVHQIGLDGDFLSIRALKKDRYLRSINAFERVDPIVEWLTHAP